MNRTLCQMFNTLSNLSSVQPLSHVWLFATPWTAACQASLSLTNSGSLLKLMFIESVMPSNHLILYHPLLLPSTFPCIRVFSSELVLHIRWPKDWRFSPTNDYSGLISFRIDWFDLAVQGTLKSLLQHSSKASSLPRSAIFMVQLSHLHITTEKTVALTLQIFVKAMSPLFNTLPTFVMAFLPRSKCLLISWLQSPSAVILEPKKIKCHCFHFFYICLSWSNGTRCHDLSFLNAEF